jgi:hypothetical protein
MRGEPQSVDWQGLAGTVVGKEIFLPEQRTAAGISLSETCRRQAALNVERKLPMRYAMTITALASGVALLAATHLSASAAPSFNLKSTSGLVQPVRSGGGGGLGRFGGGGGVGIRGGGGGRSFGNMGGGGRIARGDGGGGGNMGRMSRGGGSNGNWHGNRNWQGRNFSNNNWNRNWNGNWNRHHRYSRFYGYPFWYGGGYYAYSGYGDCAWLRRQAIITGSPYWWSRYQDCLY